MPRYCRNLELSRNYTDRLCELGGGGKNVLMFVSFWNRKMTQGQVEVLIFCTVVVPSQSEKKPKATQWPTRPHMTCQPSDLWPYLHSLSHRSLLWVQPLFVVLEHLRFIHLPQCLAPTIFFLEYFSSDTCLTYFLSPHKSLLPCHLSEAFPDHYLYICKRPGTVYLLSAFPYFSP